MKKLIILTILTVLVSAGTCFAECNTNVSGTIVDVWTKANSPYCVEDDILVASLTIEPGVRVEFLGNYVFEVAGILTANGTGKDSDSIHQRGKQFCRVAGGLFSLQFPGF